MIRIVSPDDHLVEPAHLWQSRLPEKHRDAGPRIVRERGKIIPRSEKNPEEHWVQTPEGDWADVWYYETVCVPHNLNSCGAGVPLDEIQSRAITYDQMRPGFYRQRERLEDMDAAGIDASVCYPNPFVRFCGQRFLHGTDKELALLCVKAYNDFIVEEWATGSGGRLIPLGIIPLWDTPLAVAEVKRLVGLGVHAISFSEQPADLGLPSIHSGYWDPLFDLCNQEEVVIATHIGSSSKVLRTSMDAPDGVRAAIMPVNSLMCVMDWLASGLLVRFPNLKIVLGECEIGWIPFFLNKLDRIWEHRRNWNEFAEKVPSPPSSYFPGHIYCAFFDDPVGIRNLDWIGEDNVMFESDYPHQDTNWPESESIGAKQTRDLPVEVAEKLLRGNAIQVFAPSGGTFH